MSKMRISTVVLFVFAAAALGVEEVDRTLKDASSSVDRESALDTIAYINQMNYAFTVMNTYHNVIAIQDEYDKISLDRIDITRIPKFLYNEKAMLDLIKDMLDALKAMKMNEDDYQFYQKKMEDSRRRAKKEMWIRLITAVPKVLSNVGGVIKDGLKSGGNPYAVAGEATLVLAGDLVGEPLSAILDYDKTMHELQAATEEGRFKYNQKKEKEVHEANKRLLDAEFQFVSEKRLQRADIVTPRELQALVDALKLGSSRRVYTLLDTSDMRNHFMRFAPYWYYLSSFAVDNKDWDVAIEASNKFFEVYRGLVKVDPMVAQVAIACITAMVGKDVKNGAESVGAEEAGKIRKMLEKIRDVNYNNQNADYSYFCADIYYHILGDAKSALKVLGASNAYIEGSFEAKLIAYRNKYTKEEITMDESELPRDADLIRIRTLYNDILLGKKDLPLLEKNSRDLCRNKTASSIEKLFCIGRVRISDLWQEAKNDVIAIKMRYLRPRARRNRFSVELPVSWFLLGDVQSEIELCKGDKAVHVIGESREDRKIRTNEAGIGSDIVTMTFYCKGKMLPGVDSVKLLFKHSSWPIEVTYKPSLAYDVQNGTGDDRKTEYVPVKIVFMGEEKDLSSPPDNIRKSITNDVKKKHSHYLQPFQYGEVSYRTNFLNSLTIDQARNFKVAYTNPTPYKTSIELNVRYYTRYGALLCDVGTEEKVAKQSGGTWTLAWPSEMISSEIPAYVLFQYHVDDDVFAKWKKARAEEAKKSSK